LENPRHEQAWLLMARVVDTQDMVIDCLKRAAQINPQNQATTRALHALQHPHPVERAAAPVLTTESAPHSVSLVPVVRLSEAAQVKPSPVAVAAIETTVVDKPVVPLPAGPQRVERKARQLPEKDIKIRPPRRNANWSLIIGAALVFIVAFLSVLGPAIATGDPLKETVIIKVGDKWVKPPFSPLEVPGFPLGSDQFGRDLYSRILYAIQPTMVMVAIVALVRLFWGTLIGLGAGWSSGRMGRLLDILISGALAVPVFMIVLGVIAILGAAGGNLLALAQALKAPQAILAALKDSSNSMIDQILPFVVGFSINGWGETARIVREQTQAVRGQLYIEAAHAMGASSGRIVKQHVLRQIMSMVWMLFAFEISSTLMVTAGLGFLGYYIGGDVWIEVADFVSRRVSGTPELGQMLATSWSTLTEPWPMVLTGTVIFLAVLGFNLFGEGLRVRLSPENINRNSVFARMKRGINSWTEEYVSYPLGSFLRQHTAAAVLGGFLLLALVSGGIWLKSILSAPPDVSGVVIEAPGGHLWSGELGEPYGTRSKQAPGPAPADPSVLWHYQDEIGLAGGVAVSQDGMIYVGSEQNLLIALNPDGTLAWESHLDQLPVGAPALGADGTIYVTDEGAGLTAFNPQGVQLWHYQPEQAGKPTRGPLSAEDGSIYYLLEDAQRGDTLIALAADSSMRWSTPTGTKAADTTLRLSLDGAVVYAKNLIVSTETGEILEKNLPTAADPVLSGREQYFTGADLQNYLLAGHTVMRWGNKGGDFALLQTTEWNYLTLGYGRNATFPIDAGASRDQKIWLFYTGRYGGTTVIWLEPAGEVIGISTPPFSRNSVMASLDSQNIAYICGREYDTGNQPPPKCMAYRLGSAQAEWEIGLEGSLGEVLAAALAGGKLYVVTQDGFLFVVGDTGQALEQITPTPEVSAPTTAGNQPAAGTEEASAAVGELLWTYQYPAGISGYEELQDGTLVALTDENELIKLNAQGQVVSQFVVEPGPYHHPDGRFALLPVAFSSGSYLLVSTENIVYGLDGEGTKTWEVALQGVPAGMFERRGDMVYLSDNAGYLYTFDAGGLVWQFKPDGATKAANRPTVGPDGSLYYVVLINQRAYVQQVNPDGTPGWQAAVKTGFFTYDLQINRSGTLLFLRDDIFDIQTGTRLDITPPIRVDEYMMGEDGLNYLRSGHVVSQWELTETGMNIVKSALWNYQHIGSAPFMSFVTAQKVIWLYYGLSIVWLDLDGNILNTIDLDYTGLQYWDRDNTRYYTCAHPQDSDALHCKIFAAGSSGPAWEIDVNAVKDTVGGWITESGLIGITQDNLIYQVQVDWPGE
jgi:ABC-type dipeptide/oligopeptide/nickel transport system permease subunit